MIRSILQRSALLSVALMGLALAACSSEPGRVAGLSGSPIPSAEAATTTTSSPGGAHDHYRHCARDISCGLVF